MADQIILSLDEQRNIVIPSDLKDIIDLRLGMTLIVDKDENDGWILRPFQTNELDAICRSSDPTAYTSMQAWMSEPNNSGEEWWKQFENTIQEKSKID